MGREAAVTQAQVNAVAESLVAAGQKVTNRVVREKLDAGSMSTVVKLVNIWRSGQIKNSCATDDSIDPDIRRGINNMIARRVTESTHELNLKVTELQNDLTSVILENERQVEELQLQTVELSTLRSQVHTSNGQIEQLKAGSLFVRELHSSEIKARELAQVSLAKAELQIEQLPALAAELKELRIEARHYLEEAAELRGQMIGLDKKGKADA